MSQRPRQKVHDETAEKGLTPLKKIEDGSAAPVKRKAKCICGWGDACRQIQSQLSQPTCDGPDIRGGDCFRLTLSNDRWRE